MWKLALAKYFYLHVITQKVDTYSSYLLLPHGAVVEVLEVTDTYTQLQLYRLLIVLYNYLLTKGQNHVKYLVCGKFSNNHYQKLAAISLYVVLCSLNGFLAQELKQIYYYNY